MYRNITLMCIFGLITGALNAGQIHEAVKSGERKQVFEAIIQDERRYTSPIRDYNEDGLQPIHIAAKRGDNEMLKFLMLRFDAGINSRTQDGLTPLDIAQKHDQNETVQMLRTMELHDAIATGDLDTAKTIAKNHTNTTTNYVDGTTALHIAAKYSRPKAIDMLTRYGVDINAKTKGMQETALHMASTPDVTIKLIRNGANVNARDDHQETPLHEATGKNFKVAEYLIQAGANVNAQDKRGDTPLHEAIMRRNEKLVKLYIENGADVNIQDERGHTPLHLTTIPYIAAHDPASLNMARHLIQAGAKVDIADKDGNTPLSQIEKATQMAKESEEKMPQQLQKMMKLLQQNTKQK